MLQVQLGSVAGRQTRLRSLMITAQEARQFQQAVIDGIVFAARQRPDRKLPILDQTGATIATVEVHDIPKRPMDMPRHLRPKAHLSKRQRVAVKRQKLAALGR